MPSRYEVHLFHDNRWSLEGGCQKEEEARALGRKGMVDRRAEGFRIIRNLPQPDGTFIETEVHTEFRTVGKTLTISPIEDAPHCDAMDDIYRIDSRMTITRIMRAYLEQAAVTPTELLHQYSEGKRLLDQDGLVPAAVARIAGLQAPRLGQTTNERRDTLYLWLDTAAQRARTAGLRKNLPPVGKIGIGAAYAKLAAAHPPAEAGYLTLVALSRELAETRNFLGKLDFLMGLWARETPLAPEPLAMLDGVIADVVGAPLVARDLLETQRHPVDALCALADLSMGRLTVSSRPSDDTLVRLNQACADGAMPATGAVLVDMIRRQLRGNQPLTRNEEAETDGFKKVLNHFTRPEGLFGGSIMAEALVLRYMRFLEAGGATGRRQAIAGLLSKYPRGLDRARFLVELLDSELGRDHLDDILERLTAMTAGGSAVGRLIDPKQPIKANLEQVTALYGGILAAPLPDDAKALVADQVDEVLCAYITTNNIVERLDNPTDILRHRAIRLLQVCAPGVLYSPKARDLVRQRVIAHLRQPNFETKFVEDLPDPAQQAKALRDFHALLRQVGFQ